MLLEQARQAAKRLRKQQVSMAEALAAPLSHAQALDLVAQIHGFRHYHELQQYSKNAFDSLPDSASASVYLKARKLIESSGGLFPVDGDLDDIFELPWGAGEVLALEGRSGAGKTTLAAELACQAMAQQTPVRIWDSFNEYHRLCAKLGGKHFTDPTSAEFKAAWCSDSPLVVLNPGYETYEDGFEMVTLAGMPAHGLLVCDELQKKISFSAVGVRAIRTVHVAAPVDTGYDAAYKYVLKRDVTTRDKWKLKNAAGAELAVFRHRLTKARADALLKAV